MEGEGLSNGLEVKVSKTGTLIPCLRGVHLHSMYNPQKEAKEFVEKHRSALSKKNNVLVLGLGFAYHVMEIVNILTEYHGSNYRIAIIEPSKEIVEKCKEVNTIINHSQIQIFSDENLEDLYNSPSLVEFLTNTPVVIAHPASFNLFQDYFKAYLTYRASTKIGDIRSKLQNQDIRDYLLHRSSDLDLDNLLQQLKDKRELSKMDHFLLTFANLTEQVNAK